jgi:hypothetical protein
LFELSTAGRRDEVDQDLGYLLGWFCAILLVVGIIVGGISLAGGAKRRAFQAIVLPVVQLICAIPICMSVDKVTPQDATVLLSLLVAEILLVPVITLRLLRGLPWPVARLHPKISADIPAIRLSHSPPQSPLGRSTGQLSTGLLVGPDDELPARRGRTGRCRTCGRIWDLGDAKSECLDWEQVDAYHYYCPNCYVSTRDPYFYQGLLVDGTGKAIVDQKDYRRF